MANEKRITGSDIEAYKIRILDEIMLVSMDDAAVILSCSVRTVYNRIQCGDLTGYNNNSAGTKGVRLLASEIRGYVQSMKKTKDDWRK